MVSKEHAAYGGTTHSPTTYVRDGAGLCEPKTATMSFPVGSSQKTSHKKRKRAVERDFPTKLDVAVPESRLYSRLLKFEQRVEATTSRKLVQMNEILSDSKPLQKTLRLYIHNEAHNQSNINELSHYNSKDENSPPSWTLKIQGVVFDGETAIQSKNPHRTLSNLLHRMVVQLDPDYYGQEEGFIEWRKDSSVSISDGFEIHRKGKVPSRSLSLYLSYTPPYPSSLSLSHCLGLSLSLAHAPPLQLLLPPPPPEALPPPPKTDPQHSFYEHRSSVM